MFDNELFCSNLTKLRQLKGYNKYEMSIQADIQYQYYCEIENGNATPNFRAVISIANALDTDISHILGKKHISNEDSLRSDIMTAIKKISDKNILKKFYSIIILVKTWNDVND